MAGNGEMPVSVPRRLAAGLRHGGTTVAEVRRYFRADSLPVVSQERARARRLEQLATLLEEKFAAEFRDPSELRQSWLCKAGCTIGSETLKLHMYPFFFEEWVSELMCKAERPALGRICR